jgi:predicted AlkP superfamily pyrophosphatase or phosphodiesterase
MDFIIGLPLTPRKHDSIWVIVDRLAKTAQFIPVHTTYSAKRYAEIYVYLIVRLHSVPKTLSERGTQFVARIWAQVHESLETKLIHNSSYHPQTDGRMERVNQIVEDMLRAAQMRQKSYHDKARAPREFEVGNYVYLKISPAKGV